MLKPPIFVVGGSMSNVIEMPQPQQDSFEDFWKAYPRRVGKPLARAKWQAITGPGLKTRTLDRDSNTYIDIELHATPQELVEGARKYYQANRLTGVGAYGFKEEGKYLCHPATWLNQGRWLDE